MADKCAICGKETREESGFTGPFHVSEQDALNCMNGSYNRDRVQELEQDLLEDARKTNHFDPHFLDCGQDDSYPDISTETGR